MTLLEKAGELVTMTLLKKAGELVMMTLLKNAGDLVINACWKKQMSWYGYDNSFQNND